MTQADILKKNGIVDNAETLVSAAKAVGIDLAIAAAFVERESHGRNVFGSDPGGAFSGGGVVTEAKYKQFTALVAAGHTSNGVGPLQLTYFEYFPQAERQGLKLWVPYDNMVFGLRLIKGYLGGSVSSNAINNAGQLYNSGHPGGAPEYGKDVAAKAARWKQLLTVAPPKPVKKPATKPAALPVLKKGSRGAPVKAVQMFVLKVFPAYARPIKTSGGADGKFGPGTASVIKEFQHRSGLTPDGVIGPRTWAALKKAGMRI